MASEFQQYKAPIKNLPSYLTPKKAFENTVARMSDVIGKNDELAYFRQLAALQDKKLGENSIENYCRAYAGYRFSIDDCTIGNIDRHAGIISGFFTSRLADECTRRCRTAVDTQIQNMFPGIGIND